MQQHVRLPETEFEVMREVWAHNPPVTTTILMNGIGHKKGWKLQTLTTLLNRLIERGFLRSEKLGKERTYYPLVSQQDYIRYETTQFVERYHESSITNLMNAFYSNTNLNETDLQELTAWLKAKEEETL